MSVGELKRAAEQLPEKERGQLVAELLATFPAPRYEVSDAEVARRVAETESGEVEDISFEELKAGIERREQG